MKNSLLLIGLFLLLLFTPLAFATEPYCKNIYCWEFDYICCCAHEEIAYSMIVSELQNYTPNNNEQPILCPSGIDVKGCKINLMNYNEMPFDSSDKYYIGAGSCEEETYGVWPLIRYKWKCQNESEYKLPQGESESDIPLKPGQKVYTWNVNYIRISTATIEKYSLKRTGSGAECPAGDDVIGAVGCTFNPETTGDIFFDDKYSKNYITTNFQLGENNCYRIKSKRVHCDDTCNNCESDSNCAELYPKKYTWNGRTLGGYCENGEINLYGCEPTDEKICVEYDDINGNEIKDSNEKCYSTTEKKKCDLIKRITTGIECCTSDDCQGVGDYYCNWIDDTHSKCELNVQCQRDSDCGTATKCDRQTMQIKEPYCDSEKQCSEKVLKKVECCRDSDCQGGFYCTSDYQCKETPFGLIDDRSDNGSDEDIPDPTKDSSMMGIIIGILILLGIGGAVYYFKSKTSTNESVEEVVNKNMGKFCEKCGAKLTDDDKFCTGCGNKF